MWAFLGKPRVGLRHWRRSYAVNVFMNTSGKEIHPCKSHNIKQVWNTKTSQYHITATAHYHQRKILQVQLQLSCRQHFTASTIRGLQKLGLVGMVSFHYTFLILKYFYLYPNLNEVVSIDPNLIWALVICPHIYDICRPKSEWNSSKFPRWFQL